MDCSQRARFKARYSKRAGALVPLRFVRLLTNSLAQFDCFLPLFLLVGLACEFAPFFLGWLVI